jgi:hypothetical protein
MTIKAQARIIDYEVVKGSGEPEAPAESELEQMHEKLARPEQLAGRTYKVKTPLSEHALYVTINDLVLNADTPHETRRPFEMFINSKNMDHFQWIVALTRIMSAVFRKGGDVTFLVEEMKAVFDPKGGYFKAGGVYMPSLVAELGAIVEEHMKSIGLIHDPEMSAHQRSMLAEKRAAYESRANAKKNSEISPPASNPSPASNTSPATAGEGARRADAPKEAPSWGEGAPGASSNGSSEDISITGDGTSFPPSATLCHKCSTKALVIMDGCATCLNCGYSKCG